MLSEKEEMVKVSSILNSHMVSAEKTGFMSLFKQDQEVSSVVTSMTVVESVSMDESCVLPPGLFFNSTLGVIYGTPTEVWEATKYRFNPGNTGGSVSCPQTIKVLPQPPNPICYQDSKEKCEFDHISTTYNDHCPEYITLRVGEVVNKLPLGTSAAQVASGATLSYTVAPALPKGLTFSPTTGTISGTVWSTMPYTNYTFTVTDSGGSMSASINIRIVHNPPVVHYRPNAHYAQKTYKYTRLDVVNIDIANTGVDSAITVCELTSPDFAASASDILPSGLNFNPTTCQISGTVQEVWSATYTIEARNTCGKSSTTIVLEVVHIPPHPPCQLPNVTYVVDESSFVELPFFGAPTGGPIQKFTMGVSDFTASMAFAKTVTSSDVTTSSSTATATTTTTTDITTVATSFVETISVAMSARLPNGLSLLQDGTIIGAATKIQPATMVEITASNSGGSITCPMWITVIARPPCFCYRHGATPRHDLRNAPAKCCEKSEWQFQMCTAVNEEVVVSATSLLGGAKLHYSISPAASKLPKGLVWNEKTGRLHGKPMEVVTETMDFQVTGKDTGGSYTAKFGLKVIAKKPDVLYSPAVYSFMAGKPYCPNSNSIFIDLLNKQAECGAIDQCSLDGKLPAGLHFNPATGAIASGPWGPTEPMAMKPYTVTCCNSGGCDTASLAVEVKTRAPTLCGMAPSKAVLTVGKAYDPMKIFVDRCSDPIVVNEVYPPLPEGLLLRPPPYGDVYGNPKKIQPWRTYNFTVTNAGGSITCPGHIKVVANKPCFNYCGDTKHCNADTCCRQTYTLGKPVNEIPDVTSKSLEGGANITYSISPALNDGLMSPALDGSGLSFNTATGAISGIPTKNGYKGRYKVTATDSGGSSFSYVCINVIPQPPNLHPTAPCYDLGGNNLFRGITKLQDTHIVNFNKWGPTVGCKVTPPLPKGVHLGPAPGREGVDKCTIWGTPQETTDCKTRTFTVEGYNAQGKSTACVTIDVKPQVPKHCAVDVPCSMVLNEPVKAQITAQGGDKVTTFSVSSLPNGLNLDYKSGKMQGMCKQADTVKRSVYSSISVSMSKTDFTEHVQTSFKRTVASQLGELYTESDVNIANFQSYHSALLVKFSVKSQAMEKKSEMVRVTTALNFAMRDTSSTGFTSVLKHTMMHGSAPCTWVRHADMYSAGYAGGDSKVYTPAEAKKACVKLGEKCKAITCNPPKGQGGWHVVPPNECTLRGGALRHSPSNEHTFVPTKICFTDDTTTATMSATMVVTTRKVVKKITTITVVEAAYSDFASVTFIGTASNCGGQVQCSKTCTHKCIPQRPTIHYENILITLCDCQSNQVWQQPKLSATDSEDTSDMVLSLHGPKLPNGMHFDTKTGAITGCPAKEALQEFQTPVRFNVTATDLGGTSKPSVFTVQVLPGCPAPFVYSSFGFKSWLTRTVPIVPHTVHPKSQIDSCAPSVSHSFHDTLVPEIALAKNGPSLNPPLEVFKTSAVKSVGQCTDQNCRPIQTCSVSPALPEGLSLNSKTCEIQGAAKHADCSQKTYTITACNDCVHTKKQCTSTSIQLGVKHIAPTYILNNWANTGPHKFTVDKPLSLPNEVSVDAESDPVTYSIEKFGSGLPAGLTFDTKTGVISGVPAEVTSGYVTFVVKASNCGGSVSTMIQLWIIAQAPECPYPQCCTGSHIVAIHTTVSITNIEAVDFTEKVHLAFRKAVVSHLSAHYSYTNVNILRVEQSSSAIHVKFELKAARLSEYTERDSVTKVMKSHLTDSSSSGFSSMFQYHMERKTTVTTTVVTSAYSDYATDKFQTLTLGDKFTQTADGVDHDETGGASVRFSVNKALPGGLTLNTKSGLVSGIFTTLPTKIPDGIPKFMFSVTNSGGIASANCPYCMCPVCPEISYVSRMMKGLVPEAQLGSVFNPGAAAMPKAWIAGAEPHVLINEQDAIDLSITNHASSNYSSFSACSISPSLDIPGLSFNTINCRVEGTPMLPTTQDFLAKGFKQTYTVTAHQGNRWDCCSSCPFAQTSIEIIVMPRPVGEITCPKNLFQVDHTFSNKIFIDTPGFASSWVSNVEEFPSKLDMSFKTQVNAFGHKEAVFSGTPKEAFFCKQASNSGKNMLSIVACNAHGCSSKQCPIHVCPEVFNITYGCNEAVVPEITTEYVFKAGLTITEAITDLGFVKTATETITETTVTSVTFLDYVGSVGLTWGTPYSISPTVSDAQNAKITAAQFDAQQGITGADRLTFTAPKGLPEGMKLDKYTGVISGAAMKLAPNISKYEIVATDQSGSMTTYFCPTVCPRQPFLKAVQHEFTYMHGEVVNGGQFTQAKSRFAAISQCTSDLPSYTGLTVNPKTCEITGNANRVVHNLKVILTYKNSCHKSQQVAVYINIKPNPPKWCKPTGPARFTLHVGQDAQSTLRSKGLVPEANLLKGVAPASVGLAEPDTPVVEHISIGGTTYPVVYKVKPSSEIEVAQNVAISMSVTISGLSLADFTSSVQLSFQKTVAKGLDIEYSLGLVKTLNLEKNTGDVLVEFKVSSTSLEATSEASLRKHFKDTTKAGFVSSFKSILITDGFAALSEQVTATTVELSSNPKQPVAEMEYLHDKFTKQVWSRTSLNLPPGLSLDENTGLITGVPTEVTACQEYVFTASNWGGATTCSQVICVEAVAPSPCEYPDAKDGKFTWTLGKHTFADVKFNAGAMEGGAHLTFSIDRNLPAGMEFDTRTGRISGAPATTSVDYACAHTDFVDYSVTMSNSGGSCTASFKARVLPECPALLPAPGSPFTAKIGKEAFEHRTEEMSASLVSEAALDMANMHIDIYTKITDSTSLRMPGKAIFDNAAGIYGGAVSCKLTPALPGLMAAPANNGKECIVVGAPAEANCYGNTRYTVTAENCCAGPVSKVKNIDIVVYDLKPTDLHYEPKSDKVTLTYQDSMMETLKVDALIAKVNGVVKSYEYGNASWTILPIWHDGDWTYNHALIEATMRMKDQVEIQPGVYFNTKDGSITSPQGPQTIPQHAKEYTITASNCGGYTTTEITIHVLPKKPTCPTYYGTGDPLLIHSSITLSGVTEVDFTVDVQMSFKKTIARGVDSGYDESMLKIVGFEEHASGLLVKYQLRSKMLMEKEERTRVVNLMKTHIESTTEAGFHAMFTKTLVTKQITIVVTKVTVVEITTDLMKPHKCGPQVYHWTNCYNYIEHAHLAQGTGGDTTITWSIVGNVPPGVTFDSSNGLISGTPSKPWTGEATVTATNAAGSADIKITFYVVAIPPHIQYPPAFTPTFVRTREITPVVPDQMIPKGYDPVCAKIDTCTSVNVPAGLSTTVNGDKAGAITGTPTSCGDGTCPINKVCTTCSNTGGLSTSCVEIKVNCVAPMFGYSDCSTFTVGIPVVPEFLLVDKWSDAVEFHITPPLPTGLHLNKKDGSIYGDPKQATPKLSYIITASNCGGSATMIKEIEVLRSPPAEFKYSASAKKFAETLAPWIHQKQMKQKLDGLQTKWETCQVSSKNTEIELVSMKSSYADLTTKFTAVSTERDVLKSKVPSVQSTEHTKLQTTNTMLKKENAQLKTVHTKLTKEHSDLVKKYTVIQKKASELTIVTAPPKSFEAAKSFSVAVKLVDFEGVTQTNSSETVSISLVGGSSITKGSKTSPKISSVLVEGTATFSDLTVSAGKYRMMFETTSGITMASQVFKVKVADVQLSHTVTGVSEDQWRQSGMQLAYRKTVAIHMGISDDDVHIDGYSLVPESALRRSGGLNIKSSVDLTDPTKAKSALSSFEKATKASTGVSAFDNTLAEKAQVQGLTVAPKTANLASSHSSSDMPGSTVQTAADTTAKSSSNTKSSSNDSANSWEYVAIALMCVVGVAAIAGVAALFAMNKPQKSVITQNAPAEDEPYEIKEHNNPITVSIDSMPSTEADAAVLNTIVGRQAPSDSQGGSNAISFNGATATPPSHSRAVLSI
jgi:hypothetical protein